MNWQRWRWTCWMDLFRRRQLDCDLDEEIKAHITIEIQRRIAQGEPPEAARASALREIRSVTLVKEATRDAWAWTSAEWLAQDMRHAARLLRRNPLFALTAALSLSIGIGANTTIFTVVYALLFRAPAGVVEPGRLVDIGSSRPGRPAGGFGTSSYPNYLDTRQRTTTLDGVYAFPLFPQAMSLGVGSNIGAESVFGTRVTTNYFTVLGAVPAAGRLFGGGDSDQPGASPITVLSHSYWTRRFNRDPAIVGRPVTLNGHPFTVVGVASEGFHGTGLRAGDLWVPMNMAEPALLTNRAAGWLLMGGRLKPGVSLQQAAAELDAIGRPSSASTRIRIEAQGCACWPHRQFREIRG